MITKYATDRQRVEDFDRISFLNAKSQILGMIWQEKTVALLTMRNEPVFAYRRIPVTVCSLLTRASHIHWENTTHALVSDLQLSNSE
jgi:hypothetical protein